MRTTNRWIGVAAGALFLVGSQAVAQYPSQPTTTPSTTKTTTKTDQNRTQGSGIKVTKETGGTVATTAGSELVLVDIPLVPFDLTTYPNLTEKNITSHMVSADELELDIARLAQTKATDMRVRDFANILVNDHTAHLAKTREIITDEDVGAEPLAMDPELSRMRSMLNWLRANPAGTSWDGQFLRFQARHHQNEIDLLNANLKNAHDDDLEDHIEKSVASLTKHRDMARSLATTLGFML